MPFEHIKIEKKWQKYWDENKTFQTDVWDFTKTKFYALDMFPYPSGQGLHVGHPEGYTATDIVSRMKRMQGYNVLHPMGFDAFGLPAEQYAIKTGNHPEGFTLENISTFTKQLKMLGFSFDWDKCVSTCDPKYYKWTQWIFKQLYNDGLAKNVDIPVNWCEELGTVLANDEIIDGKSERGGYPVVRKNMKQWVIDIPAYAEKLLAGLEDIDWPESTKEIQRNWIGKSVGALVDFKVADYDDQFTVFTTRCDTLFGATYCVLAPEHTLVEKITTSQQKEAVEEYIKVCSTKSELERTELNKEKTGVFTGAYAINPVNQKKIPIWISDYVLAGYGTGAIMAVPAHDDRDWEFAKKFDIDIIPVLAGGDVNKEAWTCLLYTSYCDSVLTLKDGKLKGKIMKRDNIVKENHNHAFHSLIRYSLRQLFFQKKKLVFLFLFQWILISIFFLMTTAMNGIDDAISQDEKQSVTRYMCVMENKDRNIFYDIPKIENADIQYSYHLDQLHIFSKQKEMNSSLSFLPRNTSHIQLQHGRIPSQYNEVIISESLYHSLNNRSLRIRYEDFQMELKVVGVLDPSLLKGEEIYCSQLLKDKIPFLKDEYSLILESFNMKELYQSLSRNYIVYSEVLERVESYQSLLFLAKVVANIFIGVSLFVSLLLIGIVESILYYERKHDVAYLLSLGIEPRRLVFLSLLESMTLGMIIAVIGCFISSLLYYFFNNVYHLQLHFYFHLQLKKILFHPYDLYIFIIFIYMFMVILGSLFPMKRMMKVDMINVLREE